jgi:hypothetical protein
MSEPRTTTTADRSPTFAAGCFALAVLLIGQAIALGADRFSPGALCLIALAAALTVVGIFWNGPPVAPAIVRGMMFLALAGGFARLAIYDCFVRDPNSRALLVPFEVMAALAGVLAAALFFAPSRKFVLVCFLLLVGLHLLMGLTCVAARVPGIDVYDIQMLACDALRHGRNPFAITFPDRYGPRAGFYPPGVVVDGVVQCGYFYPPLSLLFDMPGYVLGGDVRYSHIVAMTLSALLIGWMRPGRSGRDTFIPAAMLMFSPRIFYQLQVGWIEPLVVLTLCATIFCAARGWRTVAAVMLGLLCASKQYAFFAAPAALLLIPRRWTTREIARWIIVAAATGCAVTLPFVLWDPHAFYRSMTVLYGGVFRADSISFLPPLARALGWNPSLMFSIVAAVPAITLTLWRAPRSARGFAPSSALILLCVFAFSAQAFGNYYLVVIAALCAALAAGETRAPQAERLNG